MHLMPRFNTFYYLVDRLDSENAPVIRKSLKIVPEVNAVEVSPQQGLIEVQAKRDIEPQVKMACEVAGALFRTRVKKKELL
jgi:uncharacterized alpha/beta hydrolase family protein